jgi:hypothetical protein
MASKYIDLYTSPGAYYGQFNQVMQKPTIGTQQGTWRPGETQRVVHDVLNNKYYGTQSLDSLTKGLQDAIARNEAKLKRGGETYVTNAGTIFSREEFNRYDSAEIKAMNKSIANQRKYIDSLNNSYVQEKSTFFDSYDAYTGDWNNVFKRRKSNADQKEANRLQEIQNEKTRVRNKKIEGQNQTLAQKEREAKESQISTGSKARAKKLTPNLEINTGISAAADKLVQSLNKTGLGI